MAVSHQWFMQWSPSSMVVTDIGRYSGFVNRNENYRWNNFMHDRSKDDLGVFTETSEDSHNNNNYFNSEQPFRGSNVYGDRGSYRSSGSRNNNFESDNKNIYNGRTRLTGATLWLTMLGLAQTQSIPADSDTPPFSTLYKWKYIEYEFPSPKHRRHAITTGKYKPENVLPLGLEVWGDRVWVTLPSWKSGIPVTLATVSRVGGIVSPALKPYPDWSYHRAFSDSKNCSGLTSVFRINVDPCGRLWVLDSGQIDSVEDNPKQICPPSIVVFDLHTDVMLARYPIPSKYVLQNSLFANIIVDTRNEDCSDLHVYIADTWRFGLLVFRESDASFWRFTHHLFYPDPIASNFTLHGVNFQWTDGIFGLALGPINKYVDRILYFHSLSSFREFYVYTSVLRDPKKVKDSANDFHFLGDSRGLNGQSSASAIDKHGVMFFGLVTKDTVGCWDTNKPYYRRATGVVAKNADTLVFPNDIKVDSETQESVWVISNKLPMYQAGPLNSDDYNYRILFADTTEAVRSTICDPHVYIPSLYH